MSRGVRMGSTLSPQIHSSVSAPRRLCYAADRVGFEPTKRLPVYALSRRVPSAARPPIPKYWLAVPRRQVASGLQLQDSGHQSGWGGIRTHDALTGIPVFETGSFSHSDTHPDSVNKQRVPFSPRRLPSEPWVPPHAYHL